MRPINDRWKGRLSMQNAAEVAKVFSSIFGRRKRFTYTRVRPDYVKIAGITPFIDTRVDVHTGVKLERTRGGEKVAAVDVIIEKDHAMLSIGTTEYLCMYDTTLETWAPSAGEGYDYAYKFPYISFEGDRCTIKYQTPCGDQAVDVFALEIR
jgi:hypothetical protein